MRVDGVVRVTVFEYWQACRRMGRRLILVPLAVAALAYGITFLLPVEYTARSKFIPPGTQQSPAMAMLQSMGGLGNVASITAGLKSPIDHYVAIARSRSVMNALADEFNFKDKYKEETLEGAISVFEGQSRVGGGKDGVVTIEVDDADPTLAARIANAYVREISRTLSSLSVSEARHRRIFLEGQVRDVRSQLTTLETSLEKVKVGLAEARKNPATVIGSLAQLRAQINVLESRRASLLSYMTRDAPPVKMVESELSQVRSQLAEATSARSDTEGGKYLQVFREYKFQELLLELLLKQYELARVDEARGGAPLQILDEAVIPERKSKPRRFLIAASALAISLIGMLVWLIGKLVADSFASQQEGDSLAA